MNTCTEGDLGLGFGNGALSICESFFSSDVEVTTVSADDENEGTDSKARVWRSDSWPLMCQSSRENQHKCCLHAAGTSGSGYVHHNQSGRDNRSMQAHNSELGWKIVSISGACKYIIASCLGVSVASPDAIHTMLRLQQLQQVADMIVVEELEAYKRLVKAKRSAANVLKSQLQQVQGEKAAQEAATSALTIQVSHEMNHIQFEAEKRVTQATSMQDRWRERLNGLISDNHHLSTSLASYKEKLRIAEGEKDLLRRERDELLSLLDTRRRFIFRRSSSVSSDDSASSTSSFELAIAGACHCPGKNNEPCACAKRACAKQRHLSTVLGQLDDAKRSARDAWKITQIHRRALEEQMEEHRLLLKKLSCLDPCFTGSIKKRYFGSKKSSQDGRVTETLLSMLCDRTEALTQQRILGRLLAQQVQELSQHVSKCREHHPCCNFVPA